MGKARRTFGQETAILLVTSALLLGGCKSSSGGSGGTGGSTSGGGTMNSGGGVAAGGATSGGDGSGGTTATGGKVGAGGSSGAGGAQGSGGVTVAGGTSGTASGVAVAAGGSGSGVGGGSTAGGASGGTSSAGGASGSGGSGGSDAASPDQNTTPAPTTFDNPVIKYDAPDPTSGPGNNIFTADGAAMVWNDKVYLYVDQDEAPVGKNGYVITHWLLYETSDMVHWESKGSLATCKSLGWCVDIGDGGLAAPQVVERDDKDGNPKFYLYGPAYDGQGIAIAAMVADKPEGPFKDARGIPIISLADTANMGATHTWRNLDPTALVDDDGQAYLGWGNKIYFSAKLEDDMIHLKGETYTLDASGKMQNRSISNVKIIAHPNTGQGDWSDFEEAPWLSKHGSLYYLIYAAHFPETINYATSTSPEGPWQFRGTVIDRAANDPSTLHSTIFDFRGASYMGYHNAALPTGGDYRRSQCIDRVYYNADGTLKKLVRTKK
jgi:hypothetical protein